MATEKIKLSEFKTCTSAVRDRFLKLVIHMRSSFKSEVTVKHIIVIAKQGWAECAINFVNLEV